MTAGIEYKVSIIVPVFHVEQYIIKCLKSVAAQTMTEGLECIIIDDCGGDNSIILAEEFCRNYQGDISFSIVYRKQNGGLSAARNSGISQARGRYLYFLDSDDEITPDCMELMYSFVEKYGNVDLVQGAFYETEQEKPTKSNHKLPEFTDDRKMIKSFLLLYDGDVVGAQSRLVNKEFLTKHNLYFKEGIIHEDNYWTFFLAKNIVSMCFCNVRTYFHRNNPNSITRNINRDKETTAYLTIIKDTSLNIDSFLSGYQKEWILNNLITAINNNYYDKERGKKHLIGVFAEKNNILERFLLNIYFRTNGRKFGKAILHLLIRIYKFTE